MQIVAAGSPAAMTETATNGHAPQTPTDLSKRTWIGTLKRTLREFKEDDLTLLAAALTYYGILSLFPALLVLLSLLGLAGQSTIDTLLQNVDAIAPSATNDVITNAVRNLQSNNSGAGIAFIVGIAGALWSASGYVGGFMKAANVIYEVEEGRKFWKLKPLQIFVTVIIVRADDARHDRRRRERPDRPARRRHHRRRRHRRHRLQHRQVAGDRADRQPDLRLPLLGQPERQAARLPLDQPRWLPRRRPVDRGVGGVRVLRRQLRLVLEDLRRRSPR